MSEEDQLRPTLQGSVMVDIGADRGALVISTPPEMVRHEIEISTNEAAAKREHVAVRERLGRGRPSRYAAVFPSLPAGDYTVWRDKGGNEPAASVRIVGGSVTELDWR